MRSRGYDHLLDVMYIERRPLRHVRVQTIAAQLHRTKIQIWREHGRWHEVEESIYGASIRSSAERRESTQIFITEAQQKGSIFRLSEGCSYLTNCTLS
jgi:hypothetical protein